MITYDHLWPDVIRGDMDLLVVTFSVQKSKKYQRMSKCHHPHYSKEERLKQTAETTM